MQYPQSSNVKFYRSCTGSVTSFSVFNPDGSTTSLPLTTSMWGPYVNYVTKDQGTRDWRLLIAQLKSATTNMLGERIYSSYKRAKVYREFSPISNPYAERFIYRVQGDMYLHDPPSHSDTINMFDTANNRAIVKYLKKAYQAQHALQSQVVIGEAGKTLKLITQPALALRQSLGDYISKLKKLGPRVPPKIRQGWLSSSYLEWTFGVRPLMYDIEGGFEALSRQNERFAQHIRVNAKYVLGTSAFSPVIEPTTWGTYLTYRTRTDREVSVKYYGPLKVLNDNWEIPDMRNLGLDIRNFLPSAWEMIPWSFLVDYFTNIGDLFEAYTVSQGDFAWQARGVAYTTTSLVVDVREILPNPAIYRRIAYAFNPGSSTWARRTIQRIDMTDIKLLPRFELRSPSLLSRRSLNIGALIAARFRL